MLILGAGIAGIRAAQLLSEAGANIQIIEGSDRIGGIWLIFNRYKKNSITSEIFYRIFNFHIFYFKVESKQDNWPGHSWNWALHGSMVVIKQILYSGESHAIIIKHLVISLKGIQ